MKSNNLIELLNKNLSNLQLIYVKLHNYHWNVKGMNFKLIHEMTESYYDYFAEQYDEVAERIVQLGGKPFATLSDYSKNASLKEETKNDYDTKYILNSILSDFEALNKEYKEISKAAGDAEDAVTEALADDDVKWLEKEIWMVKASLY
ncbi:MAG: DNA starvation/stationary phase protection protein [Ignavibacteriales bacterium UTCHB2]|jgi:starvation-inducible DNA-binding protein|nr:MAG: DNA protection during starvation protein [Ignavibacteria bacterium ADurb.Bin266]OQY73745.1 MAG: DNA starvation/stationary phase protection protein [Ignavibacteriales bacterium UTCHB2]HQI40961.1 DNA starvation/stationary phase protection protein [Ignavibacteriaceae bacterium]HQJ45944.1 DNA starvation/stationary phase protection protein [Ignavibacteriaceae bacterium]